MNSSALSFVTFILLISFASVNAVLFTPALPAMTVFFHITADVAQYTVAWFLIGYAVAQLIYGPLTSRYGRKSTLYIGIMIQILASIGCVLSGILEMYALLVVCRFLVAIGSGVGLKMTFTLVNESYAPKVASQKISYLMLAFAVTPGLGVALGGFLNAHFGWMSCFLAGAIYGIALLALIAKLPINEGNKDFNALHWHHLKQAYKVQFRNLQLISGGLMMGASTSFVYLFAAFAPFVAIQNMGMSSEHYGLANMIPAMGLVMGSLLSAQLVKKYSFQQLIKAGILISAIGAAVMLVSVKMHFPVIMMLFLPMMIIYFGISLILGNSSSLAMSSVDDKAHGSAVMNFLNMGFATMMVLSLGYFHQAAILLPIIFLGLCMTMLLLYCWLAKKQAAYIH